MGQPYLLDELELDELSHGVGLAHPEHAGDNVLGAVAELPQVMQQLVRLINIGLDTVVQHVFDQDGMWLITNLQINLSGSLPKKSLAHVF